MKKTYAAAMIATCLLAAGCASSRTHIPGFSEVQAVNLTEYAEKGFLITPERYDGDYDALGQLYVYLYPEATRGVKGGGLKTSDTYDYTDWRITRVGVEGAVDSLYQVARSWGADGIMNFSVSVSEHPYATGATGEPTRDAMSGVMVQGFAIKRK